MGVWVSASKGIRLDSTMGRNLRWADVSCEYSFPSTGSVVVVFNDSCLTTAMVSLLLLSLLLGNAFAFLFDESVSNLPGGHVVASCPCGTLALVG